MNKLVILFALWLGGCAVNVDKRVFVLVKDNKHVSVTSSVENTSDTKTDAEVSDVGNPDLSIPLGP